MIDLLLQTIGVNRIFNGVSTMAIQFGGRYVSAEIPSNIERIFSRPFFRRLFIFFIAFIAFRDIKIAILATLVFIILFNYFYRMQVHKIMRTHLDRKLSHEFEMRLCLCT